MRDFGRRIYLVFLICLTYWPRSAFLYYYPSIFWSPTNCRFNLNKPGSGTEYSFKMKANGHLFFVCPNIALWSDMSNRGPHLSMMYENLMLVDEVGYRTCTVNKARDPHLNREILRCDHHPSRFKYTEEIFSSARAFPEKMTYKSGQTYHFISTSDGSKESLNNTSGGHCKTRHMKLKITICDHDDPCDFEMPKCPYSHVFYNNGKPTTASTTHAQTSRVESSRKNGTESAVHQETVSKEITRQETVATNGEMEPSLHPTKVKSDKPFGDTNAKQLASFETTWGSERKHIIIHITMALVILILVLSFVYVVITRRKHSDSPKGFESKLYHERQTSVVQRSSHGDSPILL